MSDDRSFHVLEAVPNRLEVSPPRARRQWSAETKARLVEASLEPGTNVSAIAREAGIAPAQLFEWRRKALKSGVVKPREAADRLGFVELTTTSAQVEIDVGGVIIRVGADIGQDELVKIIRAVKSA
jgi:transposase